MLNPTNLSATLCWLGNEFRVEGGLGYVSAFPERKCDAWGTQFLSLKDTMSLARSSESLWLRSKYVQGEDWGRYSLNLTW